jgi:hypothetical protein
MFWAAATLTKLRSRDRVGSDSPPLSVFEIQPSYLTGKWQQLAIYWGFNQMPERGIRTPVGVLAPTRLTRRAKFFIPNNWAWDFLVC